MAQKLAFLVSNISLLASDLLNYQRISSISEFLNSLFQDGSYGSHIDVFFSFALVNYS